MLVSITAIIHTLGPINLPHNKCLTNMFVYRLNHDKPKMIFLMNQANLKETLSNLQEGHIYILEVHLNNNETPMISMTLDVKVKNNVKTIYFDYTIFSDLHEDKKVDHLIIRNI